jgi:large subunit ribosomal protein L11
LERYYHKGEIMAEAKKAIAKVKMILPGGGATPAPPVGSNLGQHGVNMMDFINPFNEQTNDRKGQPTPVVVTIYEDKSMTFVVKGTPAKVLIKEALKLKKGSGVPNKDKVGKLSDAQLTGMLMILMLLKKLLPALLAQWA